jgi:superfamily II DNA/RNA helicase
MRQGIEEPFPIQAQTIPDALAGRDICGQARTGSGKTIAFAIPLVQRLRPERRHSPRGLVLVPTRELAVQVVEVLQPLAKGAGLRVAAIYGGASLERQQASATKGIDIVVATPGRLIDMIDRRHLNLDDIELAVVDEADRMADMGFLPQVERLLRLFVHRKPQILLFSATLDGQAQTLVRKYLRDPVRHEVASSTPTVDDMTHRFFAVHQMDRVRVVASIAGPDLRTLVFVRTKRGADRLTAQLIREGVQAGAIHGDLRQSARQRALDGFGSGKLAVLVATDVAARGIHVDGIDTVVHFDPAEDHKAYLHRSGRTARAGEAGVVVSFVLWNQVIDAERLQKRLGLAEPIMEIFSNDPRLKDLPSMSSPVSVAS